MKSIVLAAEWLRLSAAWAKRPATALRKRVTLFLVLGSSALREPHNGLVAGRESLASLDSSAAPNPRLAFLFALPNPSLTCCLRQSPIFSSNGGQRCFQGRAASKHADARNTMASPKWRPIICRPTGKPSSVQPAGAVAAGCPVRLNG